MLFVEEEEALESLRIHSVSAILGSHAQAEALLFACVQTQMNLELPKSAELRFDMTWEANAYHLLVEVANFIPLHTYSL